MERLDFEVKRGEIDNIIYRIVGYKIHNPTNIRGYIYTGNYEVRKTENNSSVVISDLLTRNDGIDGVNRLDRLEKKSREKLLKKGD